jgi:hypothetical protein
MKPRIARVIVTGVGVDCLRDVPKLLREDPVAKDLGGVQIGARPGEAQVVRSSGDHPRGNTISMVGKDVRIQHRDRGR